MRILILMFGILALSAGQALAADLVNKDDTPHKVRIVSDDRDVTISVGAFSIQENICRSSCRVILDDRFKVDLGYDQSVLIKNGNLFVE
jgi:hypothetical protein